jgi:hypothetical protein
VYEYQWAKHVMNHERDENGKLNGVAVSCVVCSCLFFCENDAKR